MRRPAVARRYRRAICCSLPPGRIASARALPLRMALLILIWLWDSWGFAIGVVGVVALIASTKTVVGKGYLYPLIPFNGKKLMRMLRRRPINKDNT